LNGSSSVSETYGNPCLAHSPEFQVKEVEVRIKPRSLTDTWTSSTFFPLFINLLQLICLPPYLCMKHLLKSNCSFLHAVVGLCISFKTWGDTKIEQNRGTWDLSLVNIWLFIRC